MQKSELLQYAIQNGMINLTSIEDQYEMNVRKKYLDNHEHTIWKDKKNNYFCTYVPDKSLKRGIRLIRRRSIECLKEAIVKFYKDSEDNPTINDVFKEWNDRRVSIGRISKSTHTRNEQVYKRSFKNFGKRKIKTITGVEVQDFLEAQASLMNPKAFLNLKTVVKGFLKRAKKRKLIDLNVTEILSDLDVSDRELSRKRLDDSEEIFYDDEMDKIMKYVKENPKSSNLAVALMLVTGIRVGELVGLKHSDFDGFTITIQRSETRFKDENGKWRCEIQDHPKTEAGFRVVIVPRSYGWLLDKLRICNPFGEWVFTKKDGETRSHANAIRNRMYAVCKALNIPKRSPHKARKTYGSILLDNNISAKLIETQMGHTSISCTEIHYHRDRKRLSQKMDIIDSIPEFG